MSVDTAAIETVNQEFYTAIESADLDKMTEIWAEDTTDDQVSCVHPGWTLLTGRQEVLRSWALIMANTTYIQFVLTDVNTTVLGDVAVLTCVENILTAGEEGEASFAAGKVVASNVYIRTPQGWRLWMHHGSPVLQGDDDEEEEGELEP
ncbi:nuclear transport factor 2 family protein [Nonomuraea gerenzanensis]|uniref:Alternative dihydrofolate reductase 3 n=1 Tax=Nonomuraea gerenzanensis TaxID=93944 RepID=A0A1M4DWI5_9ACTN|nr:nuclear transport factor 2 family protein [Nonomuraea gerenzanensis]UBU13271.1 nuclear transport factor 2 family protein [Nonomuraea gerenzanensis]SBO90922.1 Alternative dihydrofolate reductase 3 [Nonomuraea gerenzanensis]